jgi:glycosyltransferase A (GT-A) superfamily protein (DUF2064 family)
VTAPYPPHGLAPGSDTTLLVTAKEPRPGQVKSRLVPPCMPQQAAALAEAALIDTLHTVDWEVADAWFGPAADGGFWGLGLRVPDAALVRGVPMSTANTGASQRARLHAAGLRVADLPRLRDVDTADDAVAVARQAPWSRFAARARELAPVLHPATAARRVGGAAREQA